jgi:hypothetical protein
MLKETSKSLRTYFGIISFLFLVISVLLAIGASHLSDQKHNNQLLCFLIIQTVFRFCLGLAFGFIALKFQSLMREKPELIKNILHINFAISMCFQILNFVFTARLGIYTFIFSILIYVYLLKSVERISNEMRTGK